MRFISGCMISNEACLGQFGSTCDACQKGMRHEPFTPQEREENKEYAQRLGRALVCKIDTDLLKELE